MSNMQIANAIIREATIADCPAVAEVRVRSWRESFAGIVTLPFLDKMSVEKIHKEGGPTLLWTFERRGRIVCPAFITDT
jgi:hypothetical protein